jgi:micrococcal nuclease
MRLILTFLAAASLYSPRATVVAPQRNPVFGGTIVRVIEGDTIRISLKNPQGISLGTEVTVRLWGIDSPEVGRFFGDKAKKRVNEVVLNRYAVVEYHGRDELGRVRGEVYVNDTVFKKQICLNEFVLQEGLARINKPSGNPDFRTLEERLSRAENAARAAKLGIWSKP